MSIRVEGLLAQYNSYTVDVAKVKRKMEKQKSNACDNNSVEISEEGRKALESKMDVLAGKKVPDGIRQLSSVSSYGYFSDFEKALSALSEGNVSKEYITEDYSTEIANIKCKFEKEEDEKTGSFDCYVNKMVSVYNMMHDRIEAKYSDAEREEEYYVADNGNMELLTEEKEIEMLERAYANHSAFMATSTEIWESLKSKSVEKENVFTGEIKNQAYQAYMSAVSGENRMSLTQQKGSLNHFKLNLKISSSARKMLNDIWDYCANLTQTR